MNKDLEKELTLRNQLIDGLNRESKLKDKLINGLENDIKLKDEIIDSLNHEASLKNSLLKVQEEYLKALEDRIAKYEKLLEELLPNN